MKFCCCWWVLFSCTCVENDIEAHRGPFDADGWWNRRCLIALEVSWMSCCRQGGLFLLSVDVEGLVLTILPATSIHLSTADQSATVPFVITGAVGTRLSLSLWQRRLTTKVLCRWRWDAFLEGTGMLMNSHCQFIDHRSLLFDNSSCIDADALKGGCLCQSLASDALLLHSRCIYWPVEPFILFSMVRMIFYNVSTCWLVWWNSLIYPSFESIIPSMMHVSFEAEWSKSIQTMIIRRM